MRHGFHPDFISLHGTGTEANDLAEAQGIIAAMGDKPPECFGVKGALGHLLGAAGSVKTILTILSLRDQSIRNSESQGHRSLLPSGP
ncbi:MAG: hypothetical protein U0936_22825 [Planctomycetaceae bacterium]